MSFGFCLMTPFYSLNFELIISGSLISQKLQSTLVISIMAHLYSFNDFHILFGNYNLTLVTLGTLIRPYSYMYCTLSRDGALQNPP